MSRAMGIATAMLILSTLPSRAGATPDENPGSTSKEKPAEITQVWPPHLNDALLPMADAKDTDPNCPVGGRMWRWTVVPMRPAAGPKSPLADSTDVSGSPRVCQIQVVPTREAGDKWIDDTSVHLAGEMMTAQQTRDGRDFWESDSARGVWWTTDCARALPPTGFTFEVTVTKKEMEKAQVRRVRFGLAGVADPASIPTGLPAALGSIDVWTDPFGTPRTVPLTAPVTSVGLLPRLDGAKVGPATVGIRGIVIVRGGRAVVEVHDAIAAGKALVVYASLERDFDGDDPSPSGLRVTHAPIPVSHHIRVTASARLLDVGGRGSFEVVAPDEKSVVGLSFYVQAGVGLDAASGLSCALACTVVESLADYDGDGRTNAQDVAPLAPER